jgi:hypothetical protein
MRGKHSLDDTRGFPGVEGRGTRRKCLEVASRKQLESPGENLISAFGQVWLRSLEPFELPHLWLPRSFSQLDLHIGIDHML